MTRVTIILLLMLLRMTPAFATELQPTIGGKIAPVVLSGSRGQTVDLRRYLGGRPLLIVPVYFRCPNICGLGVSNLLNALGKSRLAPAGDVDVFSFSFDPNEGPKEAAAFESRERAAVPAFAGTPIHFLTGPATATASLLTSLGARAVVDAKTGQFAHPAAVAVVAPDGHVTAWLSTLSITPTGLRSAVDTARSEREFSLRDFIVTCFHGAVTGVHATAILMALRIAGGLTVVLILAAVTWLISRRERRP
jgi:protein SCO1/2